MFSLSEYLNPDGNYMKNIAKDSYIWNAVINIKIRKLYSRISQNLKNVMLINENVSVLEY
jgi:hypothetical protein